MQQFLPKGSHVRYGGRSSTLIGKEGVLMEPAYPRHQKKVKCLFYSPSGGDDIVANISPKSLALIYPELAYPPVNPHERSLFFTQAWNITMAWNLIRKGRSLHNVSRSTIETYYQTYLKANDSPGPQKEVDEVTGRVRKYIPFAMAQVDVEEAMKDAVDLEIPTLWLAHSHKPDGGYLLVDGRHRMYKAYHTGVEQLQGYILSVEEGQIIQLIN